MLQVKGLKVYGKIRSRLLVTVESRERVFPHPTFSWDDEDDRVLFRYLLRSVVLDISTMSKCGVLLFDLNNLDCLSYMRNYRVAKLVVAILYTPGRYGHLFS